MAKIDKVATIVTEKITALLDTGTIPWDQPWDASVGMPRSMSTLKPYRGINIFLLGASAMLAGYSSPWWGTYEQIAERCGGNKVADDSRRGYRWEFPNDESRGVRQGEKSSLVVLWKINKKEVRDDATGDVETKRWATLRYFLVFNAEQADGLPDRFYSAPEGHEHEPISACEDICEGYANAPQIIHGQPYAAYRPSTDTILLPDLAAFTTPEEYYSTRFHEMTHSTGAKKRLKREGIAEGHRFGDTVYSKEELIAEFGAAMLCGIAGIDKVTLERSAAYIDNWRTKLTGDPKLLVNAAAAAQKACDLILGEEFGESTGDDTATDGVEQERTAA